MTGRIRYMVIKESIQAFRDRRLRIVMFLVPLLQMLLFGYVVTTDVRHIATAVYDLDNSIQSRDLVSTLEGSGYFTIAYRPGSPQELTRLLDTSKVLLALQIDNGFAGSLKQGRTAGIQVIADGTDSNTAGVALGYVREAIGRFAQKAGKRAASHGQPASVSLSVQERAWFNPNLISRNYNVPGVIAIIILIICLILTSMAIVREREIGTIEQLMVTPLKPVELMLGKTIPFAAMGFANMVTGVLVAVFWFEVPLRGSIALLCLGTVIYLMAVAGIGMFISTIARTQQQAMMATFLFVMPTILLSGFMFPIKNMPQAIQYVTYINPLRYFLVIIREIFLKGNGMDVLWPQMAALAGLAIAITALSAMRFKKRLD